MYLNLDSDHSVSMSGTPSMRGMRVLSCKEFQGEPSEDSYRIIWRESMEYAPGDIVFSSEDTIHIFRGLVPNGGSFVESFNLKDLFWAQEEVQEGILLKEKRGLFLYARKRYPLGTPRIEFSLGKFDPKLILGPESFTTEMVDLYCRGYYISLLYGNHLTLGKTAVGPCGVSLEGQVLKTFKGEPFSGKGSYWLDKKISSKKLLRAITYALKDVYVLEALPAPQEVILETSTGILYVGPRDLQETPEYLVLGLDKEVLFEEIVPEIAWSNTREGSDRFIALF